MRGLQYSILGAILALFMVSDGHAQTLSEGLKNAVRQSPQEFQTYLNRTRVASFTGLDAEGSSLMHYTASCQDGFPNVRFLTNKGLKIDQKNGYGMTPLMITAGSACDLGAAHLLGGGADANAKDAGGKSPLHHWAMGYASKLPLKYLRQAGADLNAVDIYGRTPLMVAVASNNEKAVERLLKAGVDTSLSDNFGATALSWSQSDYVNALASRKKRQAKRRDKIVAALTEAGVKSGSEIVTENYKDEEVMNKALEDFKTNTLPQKQAEAKASQRQSNPRTYKCEAPQLVNLSEEEGTALKYAMKSELAANTHEGAKVCLKRLEAKQKIPFRGNTLIKYRADIVYPFGFKSHCLKVDPNAINNLSKEWNWDTYESVTTGGCNAFSDAIGGKPMKPGAQRYFEGETEI